MSDRSIVAIVDDKAPMRRLAARLLNRDGLEVKLFASGDLFLADPAPDCFSCVLLDLRMPGTNGIAVLEILKDRPSSPPVVVVTSYGDVQLAVQAMKLGAVNFVEKPYTEKDLLDAVHGAMAQNSDQSARNRIVREAASAVSSLARRHRQVLCGILTGHPNKIIAYRLGLSTRTIEGYRAHLLVKLGVRSTAAAVRLAIDANLDCSEYGRRGP